MNVFDFTQVENLADGKKRYIVDTSKAIPALIARIKEILDGDVPRECIMQHKGDKPTVFERIKEVVRPSEFITKQQHNRFDIYKRLTRELEAEPSDAWDLALQPPEYVVDAEARAVRARALALARKYYQRALRAAVGPGLNRIRWVRDDNFRDEVRNG